MTAIFDYPLEKPLVSCIEVATCHRDVATAPPGTKGDPHCEVRITQLLSNISRTILRPAYGAHTAYGASAVMQSSSDESLLRIDDGSFSACIQ